MSGISAIFRSKEGYVGLGTTGDALWNSQKGQKSCGFDFSLAPQASGSRGGVTGNYSPSETFEAAQREIEPLRVYIENSARGRSKSTLKSYQIRARPSESIRLGFGEPNMAFLVNLISWEAIVFLLALLAIMVSSMLTGRINTQGLLSGSKGDGTTYFSPERVQLLLITIGSAFQYTISVWGNPTIFPPVDASWLAILVGSHFVYLGGKLGASLLGRTTKAL